MQYVNQYMKKFCWHSFLVFGLSLITSCVQDTTSTTSVHWYDEPANKVESKPVHVGEKVAVEAIRKEDWEAILLAVGRTPKVNYDVRSVSVFPAPPDPFPVAAMVQVDRFYLYLCKARGDQWHVFRIARYER